MELTTSSLRRPSASGVERTLAALLLGLIGLYVVGTILSDMAPVLDALGVIAIHLALIVGGVFPLAVLGHAAYSRLGSTATGPRFFEVGAATVTLSSFSVALWLGLDPASTFDRPLFALAVCALLVLVGLVTRRP